MLLKDSIAQVLAAGVRDVVVTPAGTGADVTGLYALAPGLDVRIAVRLDRERLAAI